MPKTEPEGDQVTSRPRGSEAGVAKQNPRATVGSMRRNLFDEAGISEIPLAGATTEAEADTARKRQADLEAAS